MVADLIIVAVALPAGIGTLFARLILLLVIHTALNRRGSRIIATRRSAGEARALKPPARPGSA
jgi:hypothetical protein